MTILGNLAIIGLGIMFVLVAAAAASSTRHIDTGDAAPAEASAKSGD